MLRASTVRSPEPIKATATEVPPVIPSKASLELVFYPYCVAFLLLD